MAEIHVTGLSDLARFLDELPIKLQKNVMRGALRAGMKPVLEDAKAGAAYSSGLLRDGLKIGTKSRGGTVTATVTAKGEHGYVARWVEYGTKPHTIAAKDHAMFFGGHFVQSVQHPGTKPHPFMRPALDSQATAAVVAAAEYMKQRLSDKHGLDTSDVMIEGDEV